MINFSLICHTFAVDNLDSSVVNISAKGVVDPILKYWSSIVIWFNSVTFDGEINTGYLQKINKYKQDNWKKNSTFSFFSIYYLLSIYLRSLYILSPLSLYQYSTISVNLSRSTIYFCLYLFIYLSIYLSIPFYLSNSLSIYLSL
jgi:hypothetical protein